MERLKCALPDEVDLKGELRSGNDGAVKALLSAACEMKAREHPLRTGGWNFSDRAMVEIGG